ncbi:MAG TPA: DinB family protein [Aggregatilineales bacterium]|nr:DinB family protein [Aggregatilineales bacterium]
MTDCAALIEALRHFPAELDALVSPLTADQLTAHPLAGEWSIAQNVHHLADAHINGYIRARLALTEEHPPLKPYDQDAWAALADAGSADLSTSMAILRGVHSRWADLLATLDDAQFARTGYHLAAGEYSVQFILEHYVEHGELHLEQIRRTLAAI